MDKYKKSIYLNETKKLYYRIKYRFNNFIGNYESNKIMKNEISNIMDYDKYVDYLIENYNKNKDYTYFPGVTPSWYNSARNKINPSIFINSTPSKFKEWLLFHINNYKKTSDTENFIFINAWNEWAEGCHLEPCQKWGKEYLEKIKETLV